MILTNEDYEGLVQMQIILARIVKNAVMSEIEEEHEREFYKITKSLKNDKAFEIILFKRRKQLPIKYREIFNEQWFKKHTRLRSNGIYEIRCSINKVPVTGSGKDLDTAAEHFIEALMKADKSARKKTVKPTIKRILFNDFAMQWCELVKKPTVKAVTYETIIVILKAHILPFFKSKYVDEITAMQIQPLFNAMSAKGISRTAQNVKIILNQIFKGAVAERLITLNPMGGVKVLKHHNKKGTALTYEEESEFIRKLETSKYRLTYALMLYGGMRRAELASVKIDKHFVTVKNGKKRISDIESERKIPITPMLARYLINVTEIEIKQAVGYKCDLLSRAFKELCPSHHLHELRHTFITRSQECGVAREVVSVWAGHSADSSMTSTVYTHFSEEFMISEGAKVDYYNRVKY